MSLIRLAETFRIDYWSLKVVYLSSPDSISLPMAHHPPHRLLSENNLLESLSIQGLTSLDMKIFKALMTICLMG